MLLWPARIVTAQATYEPAHLRVELGVKAELIGKDGVTIETLEHPETTLVAEGAATDSVIVVQRWHVVGPNGERWLAEVIRHCGCGSTRVTGTNPLDLAW